METKYNIKEEHWQRCIQDNINLIIQCKMQIEMAKTIISLADKEIELFKEDLDSLTFTHKNTKKSEF